MPRTAWLNNCCFLRDRRAEAGSQNGAATVGERGAERREGPRPYVRISPMTSPEECVICLEDTSTQVKGGLAPLAACLLDSSNGRCSCTTVAHPACALEWSKVRAECPVCRTHLRAPTAVAERLPEIPRTHNPAWPPADRRRPPTYRQPLQWCVAVLGATLILVFWLQVLDR